MPPTLPTWEALRTEPMPSTIVQKITGAIIILIRLTKPVPSGLRALPTSGNTSPTAIPNPTAMMTEM